MSFMKQTPQEIVNGGSMICADVTVNRDGGLGIRRGRSLAEGR